MSIIIDKSKDKEKWFDYDDDVKFLIRPFPVSARSLRPGSDTSFTSILQKQATYCLEDWKGIKSVDGKDVPYTDENKEYIFKWSEALIQWICVQSVELNNSIINIDQKKT